MFVMRSNTSWYTKYLNKCWVKRKMEVQRIRKNIVEY